MGVEQSTMKQWIIHPEKDNPTHYHDGVMKRVPYPGVDVVEFEARPVKVDAVLESSDRDGEWRQRAVFKDRLFVNSIKTESLHKKKPRWHTVAGGVYEAPDFVSAVVICLFREACRRMGDDLRPGRAGIDPSALSEAITKLGPRMEGTDGVRVFLCQRRVVARRPIGGKENKLPSWEALYWLEVVRVKEQEGLPAAPKGYAPVEVYIPGEDGSDAAYRRWRNAAAAAMAVMMKLDHSPRRTAEASRRVQGSNGTTAWQGSIKEAALKASGSVKKSSSMKKVQRCPAKLIIPDSEAIKAAAAHLKVSPAETMGSPISTLTTATVSDVDFEIIRSNGLLDKLKVKVEPSAAVV